MNRAVSVVGDIITVCLVGAFLIAEIWIAFEYSRALDYATELANSHGIRLQSIADGKQSTSFSAAIDPRFISALLAEAYQMRPYPPELKQALDKVRGYFLRLGIVPMVCFFGIFLANQVFR
ncbi:MAG: hypothetical protein WD672_04475 [Woeseia sp.]